LVRLGKVSIAVKTFGVCDFSRLAVTDWRLRRWRLWFLALMTATRSAKIWISHRRKYSEHLVKSRGENQPLNQVEKA